MYRIIFTSDILQQRSFWKVKMKLGTRHVAVNKNKATLFCYRLASLTCCSLIATSIQSHFSTTQNISTIHLVFLIAKMTFTVLVLYTLSASAGLIWVGFEGRKHVLSLMHLALSMLHQEKFILEKSIDIHNYKNIFLHCIFFCCFVRLFKVPLSPSKFLWHLSYETNFLIFSRLMKSSFLLTFLWFSACSRSMHSHNTAQDMSQG